MTTRCHSVRSLRSPLVLSRQESVVATLRLAIGRPSWVRRISGSAPRLPTRMTLLTLPAMTALRRFPVCTISVCKFRFAKLPFQAAPCAKADVRASPRRPGSQAYPQTSRRPLPSPKVLYLFLAGAGTARKSFCRRAHRDRQASPLHASPLQAPANARGMLRRGDSTCTHKAVNMIGVSVEGAGALGAIEARGRRLRRPQSAA